MYLFMHSGVETTMYTNFYIFYFCKTSDGLLFVMVHRVYF